MILVRAVWACLRQYANFRGRSGRREYASWLFSATVCGIALYAPAAAKESLVTGIPFLAFLAVTLCPYLAVSVRRAHDVGHSAWYAALSIALPWVGVAQLAGTLFFLEWTGWMEAIIGDPQVLFAMLVLLASGSVALGCLGGSIAMMLRKGDGKPNRYGDAPPVAMSTM